MVSLPSPAIHANPRHAVGDAGLQNALAFSKPLSLIEAAA